MKKILLVVLLLISPFFIFNSFVRAETKEYSSDAPGRTIPKLPQTPNDPELIEGNVYPFWGPVCQRYTYSVVYKDKEGRPPEYVQIYFNGKMIDLQKENPADKDYKKGVKYIYKFVPNKIDSNFYYFEASNGLGKTRDSIIDSPDNGPVLFESAFDKNEIAVIDRQNGKKIFKYSTGKEWVGGVALSDDGQYLAAKTSKHVYLFDTSQEKPLWEFNCEQCMIGGDVKGGVDISSDGTKIIAGIGEMVILFNRNSGKPIWKYQAGNSYNVAISKDGHFMAAATAGEESNLKSNLLILWNEKSEKPLWQYHSSGNFHDVSLSDDGQYIAGATGCPDRRAYLFSKDSNVPIWKTEMLTYDSPISKSKITRDGQLAAYTTEGGPQSSVVLLFSKDSNQPLWKFVDSKKRSARGLGITPDGQYIGVATMSGDVYLFNKESNSPILYRQINAATGALDIADDGSFLAVGGTDDKVYLLERDSGKQTDIELPEFIADIDIAANGKSIAVGTGGSIYFFESYQTSNKIYPCTTIIEPEPESAMTGGFGLFDRGSSVSQRSGFLGIIQKITGFFKRIFVRKTSQVPNTEPINQEFKKEEGSCGNTLCEPNLGESKQSCPKDCSAQ